MVDEWRRPSRRGVSRNPEVYASEIIPLRRPSRRGVSRNRWNAILAQTGDGRPSRRGVSRNKVTGTLTVALVTVAPPAGA